MVAVRSMGLTLESIVGLQYARAPNCTVTEENLEGLVDVANERFKENTKRIERFRELLKKLSCEESAMAKRKGPDGEEWEDPRVRRERRKAEGLKRSHQIKDSRQVERLNDAETVDLQLLDQNT
jgi:tRNA wybutosine-synthesizing protein 3